MVWTQRLARWLFIIEGLPALLFGFVTWFYLTDWPRDASWLSREERDWLIARLTAESEARRSIRSYTVWQAVRDWRILLLTLAYFLHAAIAYTFVFFLPTILKRLTGLPDFRVTVIVSLFYVVSLIAMQFNGWHSDYVCEHRWHTAIPSLVCGLCLLFIPSSNIGVWPTVLLLGLANGCLLAFVISFWGIPSAFLGEMAGAASTGLINCIALMGGFAGPYLTGHLAARSHSFESSFLWMMIAAFVAGVAVLIVRVRPLPSHPAT